MAVMARRRSEAPMWERGLGRWIRIYIPLLIFTIITLFPFYWMLITSFKSPSELFNFNQNPFVVQQPTFEHWKQLLFKSNFPRWTLHTPIEAIASTMISQLCSLLAGYS